MYSVKLKNWKKKVLDKTILIFKGFKKVTLSKHKDNCHWYKVLLIILWLCNNLLNAGVLWVFVNDSDI